MRLHGSILFMRDGAMQRFASSWRAPIVLDAAGVTIVTRAGAELVPWTAVRHLEGWSPVPKEDR
jgi:hypothetical protein